MEHACALPVLITAFRQTSSLARLSRTSPAPASTSFHDAGLTVCISRAPAPQRSMFKVAAAILSGTAQLAGKALAKGPEKHTHIAIPTTAPTAVMIAT